MDRTTRTIHIRRCVAAVIAMVMALTMFTGVTSVSHAATVSGAKATNYGFRMVCVSWDAVKIEIPQQPAPSAEPSEPATPSEPETPAEPSEPADPVEGQTVDSAAPSSSDGSESSEPAAVPNAEPAADPDAASAADPDADPVADPDADPAAQSGNDSDDSLAPSEPNAEPAADTAADPAANSATDSAADANAAPATDTDAEQNADSAADSAAASDADPAADPMDNSVTDLFAEPVYEVITYKVYRSTARYGQYSLIRTTQDTFCIDKGLTIKKRYYYKVIAYRSNGEQYGTSAIVSVKVAKQVTANMTLLMKGNAAFNFRVEARQKLYQYDTLQGGCANGGYAYLTLYNRRVEKCKIVKVRLSDLTVVKVSRVLPIFHGNNLTFNTRKNRIVATCCTTNKKAKNRAVLINPNTLRVSATKNIKLTKKVKKIPRSVWKKNKGITAIAYNEKHNCYVARLRQDGNVVILNRNLVPLRYVKLKGKKTGLLVQGIETAGNYIYDVRSFKGRRHYCMVTVHTMAGKYVGQMKFPYGTAPGKELQCIFHDGRQFYAGFYYSTSQMDDTKRNHVNRINLIQRLNNL